MLLCLFVLVHDDEMSPAKTDQERHQLWADYLFARSSSDKRILPIYEADMGKYAGRIRRIAAMLQSKLFLGELPPVDSTGKSLLLSNERNFKGAWEKVGAAWKFHPHNTTPAKFSAIKRLEAKIRRDLSTLDSALAEMAEQ